MGIRVSPRTMPTDMTEMKGLLLSKNQRENEPTPEDNKQYSNVEFHVSKVARHVPRTSPLGAKVSPRTTPTNMTELKGQLLSKNKRANEPTPEDKTRSNVTLHVSKVTRHIPRASPLGTRASPRTTPTGMTRMKSRLLQKAISSQRTRERTNQHQRTASSIVTSNVT